MTFGLVFRESWARVSPHLLADMDRVIRNLQTLIMPGAALTAVNSGAINSGDATTDAVIGNLRTRLSELEARLQEKGLVG